MASWNRSGHMDEQLDNDNLKATEHLSHKVSRLKSLAYDIETESKEHNHLLDGLDFDFDNSGGLLSGSANRVNKLLNLGAGNRKLMCYVSIGMVTLFLIMYYLLFRVNR